METAPATARRAADQVLLPALERGLDALAQQVRTDVEPGQFFRDLLGLLIHTVRADEAAVWMRTAEDAWNRVSPEIGATAGTPTSRLGVTPPEWVTSVLNENGPQLTRLAAAPAGPRQRIASPIRQGGAPAGVLEAVFSGGALPAPSATLLPYSGALAEVVGDFLVQHELRLLRRERAEWKQWEHWLTTVQGTQRLIALADSITHDGRALTASDRVTVLRAGRGYPRVLSASGVDVIDSRSSTVQALERFVQAVLKMMERLRREAGRSESPGLGGCWFGFEEPPADELQPHWQRVQHVANTLAAGVLPLRDATGTVCGVILCERFQPVTDAATWRMKCDSLQRFTASAWSAAVERQTGVWTRIWSRSTAALPRAMRRLVVTSVVVGGIGAALTLIPADLVVTGEGTMLPAVRRDIFATTSGIVDSIRVQHGDDVHTGDTLLVLRDPAIELEATRVAGELATVRTRLSVVQAARISGTATTGDPVIRAQQLAGEEEELRQRLDSLTRQEALLTAEKQSWTLASPIDGQVLTWDVEPLLAGRPVQRGSILLEVGATAGEWLVEVRLHERDAGHVLAAWNDATTSIPVEFVPVTGTRWVADGRVRDIARVTDVDDRGDSSVRLIVTFDRAQVPELRSGKTVLPRIVCGQRALGYVWFRDLIDAARRAWWRWF